MNSRIGLAVERFTSLVQRQIVVAQPALRSSRARVLATSTPRSIRKLKEFS